MKSLLLSTALLTISLTICMQGQPADITVILHDKLGATIDRQTRDTYGLFTQIGDFRSAQILVTSLMTYYARISRNEAAAGERDTLIQLPETYVFMLADKVGHYEALKEGKYRMGSDRKPLLLADGRMIPWKDALERTGLVHRRDTTASPAGMVIWGNGYNENTTSDPSITTESGTSKFGLLINGGAGNGRYQQEYGVTITAVVGRHEFSLRYMNHLSNTPAEMYSPKEEFLTEWGLMYGLGYHSRLLHVGVSAGVGLVQGERVGKFLKTVSIYHEGWLNRLFGGRNGGYYTEHDSYATDSFSSIGVPMEFNIAWTPLSGAMGGGLGIGVQCYANLNTVQSISGVRFNIQAVLMSGR